MSGISSSTGLISGINTSQIIDQLLQIEARPQTLVRQQVLKLQTRQAAYLDLNSRIGALKSAAQKLRLNRIFDATTVASSNANVLTGTTRPGTPAGNYSFLVDRTVSTHQSLSRGFVDRNTSGLGLTSVTLESSQARLDADVQLSSLNGGAGVARGKVIVTNRAGTSTTIDLSRTATVAEVLSAFNDAVDSKVTASLSGGKIVLTDTSGGGGSLAVRSAAGYTTAASLGIEQSVAADTLTGSTISYLGDNTTVQSLNDGNGIRITSRSGSGAFDFHVTAKDGTELDVLLGDVYTTTPAVPPATTPTLTKTESAVTTIAQLTARVSAQTGGKITVAIKSDGSGIQLVDNTGGGGNLVVRDISGAAADLGLTSALEATATYTGTTADGRTLLASLGSRLSSTLNGGRGLRYADFAITARDGSAFSFNADTTGSVSDYLASINTATGGKVTASLDSAGTSIVFTDTTGGTGNLVLGGAASAELGVFTFGAPLSSITSQRLNRQYVAESTTLASLNGGRGVGVGSFTIVGADGQSKTVSISDSVKTVGDLLTQINGGLGLGIKARINDAGNGIIVEKDPDFAGSDQKITITDNIGAVAKALNLAGTAGGTGADNSIDGSFRRVVSISATDTLDQAVQKINSANAGVSASVITDGSSGSPFRLKLTSKYAGDTGQFQAQSGGIDLGLSVISQGSDSRVFYGSDDPARAILVKRASNTIDGVIDGLSADIQSASSTPVTLTVTTDTESTVTAIQDFITAFNNLSSKLKDQTAYNADTQTGGTLLGDSTALSLQSDLFSVVQSSGLGIGGRYRVLAQVGLSVSRDGSIAIDDTKLRAALQTDPAAVAEVFSAFDQTTPPTTVDIPGAPGATVNNTSTTPTFTRLGVLERIGQLADRYIDSVSGILTSRKKTLDDQIKAGNDRIADYDTRLDAKRTLLQTQFAAMESTLAKLQSQQSSISGIAALSLAR
ncbi:MAG TPA: flagellar filament capping protein FliD [Phycisphaerales bacterium]|nr:flagellar filament capping protein FliD [Phycisphaerales bacterium]